MLHSLFWVILRCLNFMCRRFGTLCPFHLHSCCKKEEIKKGRIDEEMNNRISVAEDTITFKKILNKIDMENNINPLNTKRRLLYLKTQFVPRSKHFSSRL